MKGSSRVEAITFDFFNTLIFHREGRGRGRLLIEYLEAHGLRPTAWEHGVLYDVFKSHDTDYSPQAPQGLAAYFNHIVGSADLGVAKPDARIFAHACSRLGVPADRVLHVGDTLADDYHGGAAAGLLVVLVDREPGGDPGGARVIQTLDELPPMLTRRAS